MTFTEYQRRALATAIYPDIGNNIAYPALSLVGEAGEVANKVKKILRGDGPLDDVRRAAIAKECGGVLWYIAACCREIGSDMGRVARSIGFPNDSGSIEEYHYLATSKDGPKNDKQLALASLCLCIYASAVAAQAETVMRFLEKQHDHADEIESALSDTLCTLAGVCDQIGYPLQLVARSNVEILEARQKSGTIKGDGDER